jgi:hypothetical protein
MTARCIKIHDLSVLLDKPVSQILRSFDRMGLEIETYCKQPAVNRQLLLSRLDSKTLDRLNAAAEERHFNLDRCTWTVASFPELAAQWDHKSNHGRHPSEVSFNSTADAWWKCPIASDHVWKVAPAKRVIKQANGAHRVFGCPFCSHHRSTPRRSLATEFPAIARQWHPTLNGELRPVDVASKSHKEVWWKCSKKHKWQDKIYHRTSASSSCPYCSGSLASRESSLAATEPDLAAQWHPTRNRGLKPTEVTIREPRCVWWKCAEGPDHEWQARPAKRLRSPSCPFCSNRRASKDNCLARKHPTIAREWHRERNGSLTPHDVVAASGRRLWWKCRKGPDHEWRCRVVSRTLSKTGCPCCSGFQVSVTNSLKTLYPTVAREWHPLKNLEPSPSKILGTSTKTAWWKCYRGHEWRDQIRKRTVYHHCCPACEKLDSSRVRQRK